MLWTPAARGALWPGRDSRSTQPPMTMTEGDRQVLCKYDVFTTKARGIIKNLLAQNISFETNHTSTIVPIKASHITSGPHASSALA